MRLRQLESDRPELAASLHESWNLKKSDVVWAVRHEMARTVEDVLARRTRLLFLDARVAQEVAGQVAALMAEELGKDDTWREQQLQDFSVTAQYYSPHTAGSTKDSTTRS